MKTHQAIVLDIEGTTTSISFVYDTLFPYAKANAEAFIQANWGDASVAADLELIRDQAKTDAEAGVEGVVTIPEGGLEGALEAIVANVHWQMANDRKTTGLKSLQGKIWAAGYADGTLLGHIFDDVVPALERWKSDGKTLCIYSSGSVAAQKLLFGHSTAGDLTPFFAGYFDTKIGAKTESAAYEKIVESLELDASAVLFATDKVTEAVAASGAGLDVVILDRPGNPDQGAHDFPVAENFMRIF